MGRRSRSSRGGRTMGGLRGSTVILDRKSAELELQDNGSRHIWLKLMNPKNTKEIIAEIQSEPLKYNWFGRVSPTKKGIQALRGALDRYGYENWDMQYGPRSPKRQAAFEHTMDFLSNYAFDVLCVSWFVNSKKLMAPVIVRPSDKGGWGVTALKDFDVGELICWYPIHYWGRGHKPAICKQMLYSTGDEYAHCVNTGDDELCDEIWDRVPKHDDRYKCAGDYGLGIGDDVTVFADPTRPVPSSMYGAFMNDGGYRVGMTIDEYDETLNNATWGRNGPFDQATGRVPGMSIASRAIKKGDEICIAYGRDYWFAATESLGTCDIVMQYGGEETDGLTRAQCCERGFEFGPEYHGHQIWRPSQAQTLAIMSHYK